MRNQKGNIVLIVSGVVVVAIIAGVVGYLVTKKQTEEVEQKKIEISVSDFINSHTGKCYSRFSDEGNKSEATIYGYVEWTNVFYKEKYPDVPHEKFFLRHEKNQASPNLEVSVEGNKSKEVFEKLLSINNIQEEYSDQEVFISDGIVFGYDMPIMKGCSRGAYIIITDPSQINFIKK